MKSGANMWVPFAILAVATIAIGVVGFIFQASLIHLLGGYLVTFIWNWKGSAIWTSSYCS